MPALTFSTSMSEQGEHIVQSRYWSESKSAATPGRSGRTSHTPVASHATNGDAKEPNLGDQPSPLRRSKRARLNYEVEESLPAPAPVSSTATNLKRGSESGTRGRSCAAKRGRKKGAGEEPNRDEKEQQDEQEEAGSEVTPKQKPKKAKKEAVAMPLAARTKGLRMFVGAHVSAAKGG